MLSIQRAPGRVTARSGVLSCGLVALAFGACEPVGRGATIQLDTAEVQLGRGTGLHDVRISGVADTDSVAPVELHVRPGDVVRFTIDDHRTHAIGFDVARLEPLIREYLDRTNQLRSPPLVNRGAAWVVALEDAPPGRYPFLCRSHGARGMLVVGAD